MNAQKYDTIESESLHSISTQSEPTIALMLCGTLFEDFFDTIGVSFDTFRTSYVGSYQFGYINALRVAGVRTVLIYISARVSKTLYFTHEPSGVKVCILPAPILHRVFRHITRSFSFLKRRVTKSLDSYLILPLGLLAHELRHEGCNAILFQDYENPSFDVCVALGKFMRLPVFATFQGGGKRSRLEEPIRPIALQACSGLIIAAQAETERVYTNYNLPNNKIARIFNPIDLKAWQAVDRHEVRNSLDIPLNAKVVVCHGRIDITHKGLDILLNTWEQICNERPEIDLRLLLVGTGNDAEQLKQQIIAKKLRGVHWINEFVHDQNLIRRYLSAADVYTLSSRFEGFPVAPIEAMACGLPVVATDAQGIAEILELGEASGGLIVPREDAKALALALGRVLDDEALRHELATRARCRVEECFSLEAVGKQLRDFFFRDQRYQ